MQRLSYRGCGVGAEQAEGLNLVVMAMVEVVKAAATGVH
jgi:hypothetical protein